MSLDTASRPRQDLRVRRRTALGAALVLVASLTFLALAPLVMPESYSWVEHGTSESAAQTIDGAWVARLGFILYGLAVLWLVRLRSHAWGPLGTVLHLGFGASMFGVAAFATKPWEEGVPYVVSEDLLHGIFSGAVGFSFIAGVTTVLVVRRHRTLRSASPDLAALGVAAVVPLMMSSGIWGVLQRVMFFTAGAWYLREAWIGTQQPGLPRSSNPSGRAHMEEAAS